jgi:PKD repeat protein
MKKMNYQTSHILRTLLLLVLMGVAPLLNFAQVQQNTVLQPNNDDQWAGLANNCMTTGGYVSISTTNSYPVFGTGIELAQFAPSGNIMPPFMLYTAPTSTNTIFEARDIQKASAVTSGTTTLPAGYFIVGVSRPTTGAGSTMLYLRTDCVGNVLWSRIHANPNLMTEEGVACVPMLTGDSYYVGKIQATTAAGTVMYVARFGPTGTVMWGNQYQCYNCTAFANCSIVPREATLEITAGTGTVQAAANQGLAITGESTTGSPNIPGMQAFVSVINSVGTEVWRNAYYLGTNYSGSAGYDIVQNTATGQGNRLTVAGRADQAAAGTVAQSKIYVFQVNPIQSTVAGTSNLVWADVLSPTSANITNTYGRAIEVSASNPNNYVVAGPDFNTSSNGASFLLEVAGATSCTAPISVVWANAYPNSMAHPSATESISRLTNGYYVTSNAMGTTATAATTDLFEIYTDLAGNTPTCPMTPMNYLISPSCNYFALAKCKSTDITWTVPVILTNPVTPAENACPVACGVSVSFTDSTDCSSVNFTSSIAGCPPGSTITYNWTFGDGTSSTVANPSHSYIATGTYNVCLTVICTNAAGVSCTAVYCKAVVVSNVGATTDFCYSVSSNLRTLTISGVTTTGCTGTKTYTWDFGDGTTSTLATPAAKTYATAGTYTVCVITKCTVNGITCCTKCCKVIEIPNPCPTFFPTFTVTLPTSGLGATFTPTAGTTGYSYAWTFTNSAGTVVATSAVRNPTIVFPNIGTYTACVTVSYGATPGAICVKSMCKTFVISQNNSCTLNANYKYTICTNATGTATNSVTFASTSTGTVSTTVYSWDFGDGSTLAGTATSVTHNYATSGSYLACLYINNGTCDSRVCITINVGPKTCNSVNCITGVRMAQPEDPNEEQQIGDDTEGEANMKTPLNEVRFFPNPTDNVLNIVSPTGFMQGTLIKVANVMGNQVYEKLIGSETSTQEIDMSHFSAGVYLISIRNTDGTTISKKVVKE